MCLQPLQPVTQILKKDSGGDMDIQFQSDVTPAVINYICEVVYPEQLALKVCVIFQNIIILNINP